MRATQSTLVGAGSDSNWSPNPSISLEEELRNFRAFGSPTSLTSTAIETSSGTMVGVDTFVNEFWTSKQREASSLHEISYRACFKPQLPRFFIERLTRPGDVVYDPFMGRGTTLVEAALLGRMPFGCDANPLSKVLVEPRLSPPAFNLVAARLHEIRLEPASGVPEELHAFYHPRTLSDLCALRGYFLDRERTGELDGVDRWIRMVAVNRLTGHSRGFFSVYTLPPNQAVSVEAQRKINADRNQVPEERDVRAVILAKTRSLLSDCSDLTRRKLEAASKDALLLTKSADTTPEIASSSVDLVVTSPPFLNVVDYAADNWLRWWFCGIDPKSVSLTVPRRLETWQSAMTATFGEMSRLLRTGGHIAFEVGEVRGGRLPLEKTVVRCGLDAGLVPRLVLINDQEFTKTSNLWGIRNSVKGTNTNRVTLFGKG
jgi:hypothetical protein